MAGPKKEAKSGIDAAEEWVLENWYWILAALAAYLIFAFGFQYAVARFMLSLIGVIILGRVAWVLWVHYIRQDFISGIDYVLLEIIPPREVLRSPKAMELFITNALYHWSIKGGLEEYWQGAVWFWFSLEIASIDGRVGFYIRTPTRIRGLIETQMYAQYPQAQVRAVEDYTLGVDEITPTSEWNGWGCEFKVLKDQSWPIKTYVDFGLDKDPKEEFKVDPVSPIVELFGSIQKGEQMWMQIVITPSKKTYRTEGTLFGKHDWVTHSRVMMEKWLKPYTRLQPGIDGGFAKEIRPPDAYKNALTAMNAKTGKLGFDTGIRIMYVATKEIFPPGHRTNNSRDIRLMFRQFAKPDCNELWRINPTQADAYSGLFPASTKTIMTLANRMLHEYRERAFFHLPLRHHLFSKHTLPWPIDGIVTAYFHHETFVLNTEEIATIWHFPGQIMRVPTLERIESKEASPPTNLPT
ncbi:MAG TPA: hypothetical protein VJH06_02300 [Candidatus Paceibacterota bacterium]